MRDIVLITAESLRIDFIDALDFLSQKNIVEGIVPGHYTRTSLAGLHSSSYLSAIKGRVVGTSLAEVLSQRGYKCIGLSPNANTNPKFNFEKGFDIYDSLIDPNRAPNKFKQYLAKFEIIRRIYYFLNPPFSKFDDIPSDREIISKGINYFNESEPPRFLWLHLMGSHRPYGRGEDAISKSLRKKAFFSPDSLTEKEEERIKEKYRRSISRIDEKVKFLLKNLDSNPILFFTGDHGESFGESSFYFHQPHLLKINKALARVPVIYEGLEIEGDKIRLIDIPPTILDEIGEDIPKEWHGESRLESTPESALTIGVWGGKFTLFWQDLEKGLTLTFNGEKISFGEDGKTNSKEELDEDIKERLRSLGYLK